jgi:hypothetical protein
VQRQVTLHGAAVSAPAAAPAAAAAAAAGRNVYVVIVILPCWTCGVVLVLGFFGRQCKCQTGGKGTCVLRSRTASYDEDHAGPAAAAPLVMKNFMHPAICHNIFQIPCPHHPLIPPRASGAILPLPCAANGRYDNALSNNPHTKPHMASPSSAGASCKLRMCCRLVAAATQSTTSYLCKRACYVMHAGWVYRMT